MALIFLVVRVWWSASIQCSSFYGSHKVTITTLPLWVFFLFSRFAQLVGWVENRLVFGFFVLGLGSSLYRHSRWCCGNPLCVVDGIMANDIWCLVGGKCTGPGYLELAIIEFSGIGFAWFSSLGAIGRKIIIEVGRWLSCHLGF